MGHFHFLSCKQIPPVICHSSPTEQFRPEPQSASSPWHSDGTRAHCCLHVKHGSICAQTLKELCSETLRGKTQDLVFRIYPSNLMLSVVLFMFQILSEARGLSCSYQRGLHTGAYWGFLTTVCELQVCRCVPLCSVLAEGCVKPPPVSLSVSTPSQEDAGSPFSHPQVGRIPLPCLLHPPSSSSHH